jgi:hypothetical protein
MIGDIPWGIGYCSEEFGLVSLDNSYYGAESLFLVKASRSTVMLTIHPHEVLKLRALGAIPPPPYTS